MLRYRIGVASSAARSASRLVARRESPSCSPGAFSSLRYNSKSSSLSHLQSETFELSDTLKKNSLRLPFDARRNGETFGQLVRSDHVRQQNLLDDQDDFVKRYPDEPETSPFRNPDGSHKKGNNAQEARLDDLTLLGKADSRVAKLPQDISIAIGNNILSSSSPARLRTKAAQIYQSLSQDQLQTAPESGLDCNAHIAALFLQDYAHCHQVLGELKNRVENFDPQSVLTVGYGPATPMVALNELMGDDFAPPVKDVYIVGRSNNEMKKRAKIILSRQLNEQIEEEQEAVEESQEQDDTEPVEESVLSKEPTESKETESTEEPEEEEYIGPVDASKIKIRSKLRDSLPVNKQYDLIVVNQALLTREYHFPRDIDVNMDMLLKILSPNGHIVLIERGNALGFETIARARQLMIRPESFNGEQGKIPRPYIKGSSIKPQRMRKVDQLITEEHIKYEEELLEQMEQEDKLMEKYGTDDLDEISDFEKGIIEEHGEIDEDELKFEFEDDQGFEVVEVEANNGLSSESVDYHLSIVAPCSHQFKCPLQLGDPKYYKIPSHKHRLSFCSFDKVVERPRYTMELKKGRKLAMPWDKGAEDGFGFDNFKKKDLKKLEGTGRPGSGNTESGSFAYVIAQRAPNDVESIQSIEQQRQYAQAEHDGKDIAHWPRIISHPNKIKNNVKLTMCAPSGNVEVWQVPKSLGKQAYHDARKAERGDLWGLDKKSVIVKNQLSDKVRDKLDVLAKTQKKTFIKEQRKKVWKKLTSSSEDAFKDDIVSLADSIATNLESTKKYKTQGKKARFDVDLEQYEGR